MHDDDWLQSQRASLPFNIAGSPSLSVSREGSAIAVIENGDADNLLLRARWIETHGVTVLNWGRGMSPQGQRRALLAALSAVFASQRSVKSVQLGELQLQRAAYDALCHCGALTADAVCLREAWAQQADLWLTRAPSLQPAALTYTITDGARHPRRAPNQDGTVYMRDIPAFGRFTLRTASLEDDLDRLHSWMNEPRVHAFWGQAGSHEAHRAYLERVRAAPHIHPLIGALDGEPFGYFEGYWAKEDRIAPYATPGDYDRGVHMLVGATRWRGAACVAVWLPSLIHYLLLDDPRTQAVFCEPHQDNIRMIHYLEQHGLSRICHFDFPHKRALLMRVIRETFFDKSQI